MRVIDLLNKIANGEEVPKKIKYRDKVWEYLSTMRGKGYQYCATLQGWRSLQEEIYLEEHLNDGIEIIEEDKKIEKIYELNNESDEFKVLRQKINEIIDYINKGDKE